MGRSWRQGESPPWKHLCGRCGESTVPSAVVVVERPARHCRLLPRSRDFLRYPRGEPERSAGFSRFFPFCIFRRREFRNFKKEGILVFLWIGTDSSGFRRCGGFEPLLFQDPDAEPFRPKRTREDSDFRAEARAWPRRPQNGFREAPVVRGLPAGSAATVGASRGRPRTAVPPRGTEEGCGSNRTGWCRMNSEPIPARFLLLLEVSGPVSAAPGRPAAGRADRGSSYRVPIPPLRAAQRPRRGSSPGRGGDPRAPPLSSRGAAAGIRRRALRNHRAPPGPPRALRGRYGWSPRHPITRRPLPEHAAGTPTPLRFFSVRRRRSRAGPRPRTR